MKKRIVAMITAVVILIAVAPFAIAINTPGEGEVEFTLDPNQGPGVTPGPGPDDGNNFAAAGLNFDFGEHDVSFNRETHQANVLTGPGGSELPYGAHVRVRAISNFNVTLSLAAFENTTATGNPLHMPLSYIVVNPNTTGTVATGVVEAQHAWGPVGAPGAAGSASFSNQGGVLTPGATAAAQGSALQVMTGTPGQWDASIPATLVVAPTDALEAGVMRAVMQWTFIAI